MRRYSDPQTAAHPVNIRSNWNLGYLALKSDLKEKFHEIHDGRKGPGNSTLFNLVETSDL
jgi:hypothetical protein